MVVYFLPRKMATFDYSNYDFLAGAVENQEYEQSSWHKDQRLLQGQREGALRCTSSTAQGGGGSFKNRKRIGEIDCCE